MTSRCKVKSCKIHEENKVMMLAEGGAVTEATPLGAAFAFPRLGGKKGPE